MGDFFIGQLLSITSAKYESFDDEIEARSLFKGIYQEHLTKSGIMASSLV